MRDAQHLVRSCQLPELLAHHVAHAPAQALVNFIKNQRGGLVCLRQHALERQHQARRLAARRNFYKRLQRFAGVWRNHELQRVNAGMVKRHTAPAFNRRPVRIICHLHRSRKLAAAHL